MNRESGPRSAGKQRLQRAFRVGVLPPAVTVQQPGRLPGSAATRQRAQRRRLGGTAAAGDGAATGCGKRVALRGDAAFAKPKIYEAPEERSVHYAIRLPANENPQREVAELLLRPVGRPSRKPLVRYQSFLYRAASWSKARRVVAKVEHHAGELFPRDNFIVTNLTLPSRSVVRFYNKRGTAEQWIKEGKQATHWTRLSCHRFRANEVRLQLSVLAYNLSNPWRRLGLPPRIKSWSLTSLQQRLVKTGGRLIKHARYYWLISLTSWVRRRLRCALWRQWKTARRRRAALLHLAVRPRLAATMAGRVRGSWHLACTQALNFALSNAHFKSLGLPSLVEGC